MSTAELEAKVERLRADCLALYGWAREQGQSDHFADQVAQWAMARLLEWDLPVAKWEP